ncbi:hypothetical protein JCM10450v2_000688 [Rhodotorula kratochvilovae]
MKPDDASPHISIAAGIVIGLVASFVQSLGLTVQRLSHISNERQPPEKRKRDWQRPLWLAGFAVFILSNVFGTLFQIGALPIVVLGPLGAVSLLWNAFFARIILGDSFTVQLAVGSVLIAGGATLVGIFGVVPEQTYTLPELLALYRRPAFVTWVSLLGLFLALVLLSAHWAEHRLARTLAHLPAGALSGVHKKRRRWSLPTHRPRPGPAVGEPEAEPLLAGSGRADEAEEEWRRAKWARGVERADKRRGEEQEREGERVDAEEALARVERTKVWIAVGYGATSGTLSGLCLLITKTGIDLLISTITSGENQFGHLEAWIILAALLLFELVQLAYLNRALRLVGPTLVCPLSFCFYNSASIASGLIFFKQVDALSRVQVSMVVLGSAVLLAGVWIVSVKAGPKKDDGDGSGRETWTEEPVAMEMDTEGDESGSDDEPVKWRPRGFSIGLGAASPGFEIRPATLHRAHTSHHPSPLSPPPPPDLAASTASLPAEGRPARRRHHHVRGESLSGAPYVGDGGVERAHHRRGGSLPPSTPAVGAGQGREVRIVLGGEVGAGKPARGWWRGVRDRLRWKE